MKGAFPSQGSGDDEISLGAYVAAALLELGQPLKVSTPPLPPALLYAPTPGHRYGVCQLVVLAAILQARNRWEGADVWSNCEVVPQKRQYCKTGMV